MLDDALTFARQRPAVTAAAAVGAATLAWALWPRQREPTLFAPLPKLPEAPETTPAPPQPAPAAPQKGPRLPGNSPRAQEANGLLELLDVLRTAEGIYRTTGFVWVKEGPRSLSVFRGPPFYVLAETYRTNTSAECADGSTRCFGASTHQNYNSVRAHLYRQVMMRRSAFALNNEGGCWRGLGPCRDGVRCSRQGVPFVVPRVAETTNGLTRVRLQATDTYSDGTKNTATLFDVRFSVPLPRGFTPSDGPGSEGRCTGPMCGNLCAWLQQDWQIWGQLGVKPFSV